MNDRFGRTMTESKSKTEGSLTGQEQTVALAFHFRLSLQKIFIGRMDAQTD